MCFDLRGVGWFIANATEHPEVMRVLFGLDGETSTTEVHVGELQSVMFTYGRLVGVPCLQYCTNYGVSGYGVPTLVVDSL